MFLIEKLFLFWLEPCIVTWSLSHTPPPPPYHLPSRRAWAVALNKSSRSTELRGLGVARIQGWKDHVWKIKITVKNCLKGSYLNPYSTKWKQVVLGLSWIKNKSEYYRNKIAQIRFKKNVGQRNIRQLNCCFVLCLAWCHVMHELHAVFT